MPKILLSNDFHGTEATVRPVPITDGRFAGYYKVSQRVAKRLHNALCGSRDCTCGDTFGARSGHYLEVINQDYDRNFIVRLHYAED